MNSRYPRDPVRFPRKDITAKDIESATTKTGVVDLSKIRKIKERRVVEKKKTAKKASDTRKKHNDIFDSFMEIYKGSLGVDFVSNNKNRVISYRDSEGKLIRQRRRTDFKRLIDFYEKLNIKYSVSLEEFSHYIMHAIKISVVEFEHCKQNHIFGMVISEKVSDKYFVRLRRKQVRSKNKKDDRNRHKKYFKDVDER